LHNFIALTADISVGLFIVDFETELSRQFRTSQACFFFTFYCPIYSNSGWLYDYDSIEAYISSLCVCFGLIKTLWRPLLPYGSAIKHPAPDRVMPSFVTFDILALWGSTLVAGVSFSRSV